MTEPYATIQTDDGVIIPLAMLEPRDIINAALRNFLWKSYAVAITATLLTVLLGENVNLFVVTAVWVLAVAIELVFARTTVRVVRNVREVEDFFASQDDDGPTCDNPDCCQSEPGDSTGCQP